MAAYKFSRFIRIKPYIRVLFFEGDRFFPYALSYAIDLREDRIYDKTNVGLNNTERNNQQWPDLNLHH